MRFWVIKTPLALLQKQREIASWHTVEFGDGWGSGAIHIRPIVRNGRKILSVTSPPTAVLFQA